MIIGQILTVAAAAIALQAVLPSIWTGFQLIGGSGASSSPTSATGAANAIVFGVILLAITTTINILGIRLMSLVNSTGVVLELIGVVAIVATLLFHARRGPSVLFTTAGAAPTHGSSYIWAWAASGLMAAYVMVGFDSAGELSEETHAPRHITARTIVRALVVSGIGGALLLISALLAAPSLTDGNMATVGLPYVLTSIMGPVGGRILLVDVIIAICVCTLACQTSGSRMMFSMARQRALPFHRALSRVSPRTGTPVVTSIVVGAGAALVLVVNLGDSAVFTALSSLCIAMLYMAYLGVTAPLLAARLRQARHRGPLTAETDERGRRLFDLGVFGIPLNIIACLYQVVAILNLAWPRKSVYDLTGHSWWLQWSAVLFIALTLIAGLLVHLRLRRGAAAIPFARLLHGHAAAPPVPAGTAAGPDPA
jgi:urea carboxylase system permease